MNSLILIVFYALCQEILEGKGLSIEDDSQSDYRLPGKIILSNIIRQQNRPAYIQKFKSRENSMRENLDANILTQFLNRFQPALDRETKKLVDKPNGSHHMSGSDSPEDIQNKGGSFLSQPLWRDVRDDFMGKKAERKLTQCTRVPGRVLCKFGPYTYVINTRDRDLDNEELEKIVGMMHQRIQEGDKNFDLSIVSPKDKTTVALDSAPEPFMLPEEEGSAGYDSPPVIVECTPVEKPRNRFSGSDNVEEIVYNCKWHSLKLKRDTKPRMDKSNEDSIIIATPVAKTCSTAMFVRKFSDICTTSPSWCRETTLTPCPTTQLPYCVPWCNPFLKDSGNPADKIVAISKKKVNMQNALQAKP